MVGILVDKGVQFAASSSDTGNWPGQGDLQGGHGGFDLTQLFEQSPAPDMGTHCAHMEIFTPRTVDYDSCGIG